MAAVRSPNIPAVHLVDEDNGLAFYARDFVEGETLARQVRTRRIRAAQAIQAVAVIAEAVGRCHGQGLIHRNLHPSNILIATNGVPWLIGFSRIRAVDDHPSDPTSLSVDLEALKDMIVWLILALHEPVPKSLAAVHAAQTATELSNALGNLRAANKRWWQFWK